MKVWSLISVLSLGAVLAGCGGGGGGGGSTQPPQPPEIPANTFTGTATGASSFTFNPNVKGATASGTTVNVYGDELTGPANNYTSSRRLTLTLYGPVSPGTYYISTSTAHNAGTATAAFLESTQQNGVLTVSNVWQASSGSVTVNAADGSHIVGTFSLTMSNGAGKTLTWTNGQFNVSYSTPPGQP